jgi:hypothetical protein
MNIQGCPKVGQVIGSCLASTSTVRVRKREPLPITSSGIATRLGRTPCIFFNVGLMMQIKADRQQQAMLSSSFSCLNRRNRPCFPLPSRASTGKRICLSHLTILHLVHTPFPCFKSTGKKKDRIRYNQQLITTTSPYPSCSMPLLIIFFFW